MSPDAPKSVASSEALLILWSPDGYYTYLNIPKTSTPDTPIDADLVKKNYRKLSLKHHPDRNGGDADTFRVLNRAQLVLTNPKLKQQYDILGIDLDDDDEDEGQQKTTTDEGTSSDHSKTDEDGNQQSSSTSQGIVHEMAGMALTAVLQLGVRTGMMALVSLLIARYIWTLIPAMAFLAYIAYQVHSVAAGTTEMSSPFIMGTGLVLMYQSRESGWFLYWVGETLVIAMFTLNSLGIPKTKPIYAGIALASSLAALWFRGKFWNYAIVIGLELFLAFFIAMAFPIMEMVLEAILNDKLRKVGDKVRAHHEHMKKHYESSSKR